jgi:hypothetical protein
LDETQALAMAHDSIHAEYRQALADAQWALANSNAEIKVKDAQIKELQAKLAAVTEP